MSSTSWKSATPAARPSSTSTCISRAYPWVSPRGGPTTTALASRPFGPTTSAVSRQASWPGMVRSRHFVRACPLPKSASTW